LERAPLKGVLKRAPLKGVLKRAAGSSFVNLLTPLKGVLKRVPFIGVGDLSGTAFSLRQDLKYIESNKQKE